MTGVAAYATTDTPSSPVGTTYPITVTGLVSQNYEIATVPGTLTIAAAASTTTLVAAQTTGFTAAQYGDTVTLTATVAPTTATGTVVFLEGQNVLGTAQVGSGTGVATLALTTLQAGRHTITAMYLGDNNLGASTSTPVTIVVSQKTGPSGEPYLIVTANDTSRIYGQANPAFTYTVSGALLNGDTPATAVKGVPIYSTPASLGSPAGTYPVSIVGGLSSLNYLIEFQDGTFTVTPTSLTVALASSPNPVTYGSAVTFTATLPIDATGTVTFYDGTTVFGTGSISGGVATQPTNSLTAGTHSITAQYEGDVNYNAAVSTALSQVVNKATPTITLASSLNPSTFGASVTFTATLPADATGTVTFLDGATSLGTGTHQQWHRHADDQFACSGHALDHGAVWRGYQLQRRSLNPGIAGGDAGDACDYVGESCSHHLWHTVERNPAQCNGQCTGNLRVHSGGGSGAERRDADSERHVYADRHD